MVLPVMAVIALAVWILCGAFANGWWLQMACFALTVYLLVELSNRMALLRVRSRMVSSVFIALSSAACRLYPSTEGAIVQLCFVVMLAILFTTYQDRNAPGHCFYAMLSLGIASLFAPCVLLFFPVILLLLATQLQAFSGRNVTGMLFGLLLPYWLLLPIQIGVAMQLFGESALGQLTFLPFHYLQSETFHALTVSVATVFSHPQLRLFAPATSFFIAFVVVLTIAGTLHFWQISYEEKIQVRLLYGFFISMTTATLCAIALLPGQSDVLLRVFILCSSPVIAHFFTFTSSRLSNATFIVSVAVCLLLTVYSLLPEAVRTLIAAQLPSL